MEQMFTNNTQRKNKPMKTIRKSFALLFKITLLAVLATWLIRLDLSGKRGLSWLRWLLDSSPDIFGYLDY
jgi:hypothetical protein